VVVAVQLQPLGATLLSTVLQVRRKMAALKMVW
jgi:hypothetical protein